jgi:release factor glutamine methyltransferase
LDLIAANPPYVSDAELRSVSREVQREPRLALAGGADGLDVIRRLVPAAGPVLRAGGLLAVEHGATQGAAVRALFERSGFVRVATARDLAGLERVTSGRTPG